MKITLNGKEYPLNFGIGFIHTLDGYFHDEDNPAEFGTGVNMIWLQSQNGNPYPMFQALRASLQGEFDLTENEFDKWVDGLESDKEYTSFFKEFFKTLETKRMTGNIIATYKKNLAKLQKMVEAEQK